MSCIICYRDLPLTRHHLIPISRHKNKKALKHHGKEALSTTIEICRECHNQLHATISEKEMVEHYYSLERLLSHPEIIKFTSWIRKHQPMGKVKVKRPARRRRRR